jgi:hypothetical protein
MSFVYLISAGEDGPVKVGVSDSPECRLSGLQSGNPIKLYIAAKWKMPDRRSAFNIERAVLDEMKAYRLVGEWIDADELGMRGLIHHCFVGAEGRA